MDKAITDKYHQQVRDDNRHLNPAFDLKEAPKRTYQLGLAALLTGIALAIYDAYIGAYVSSFLVACFCFLTMMFILLKYNGNIQNLKLTIICLVSGLVIFSTLFEGLQAEQFLYFFPILVAVPMIINIKTARYEPAIYIGIIIFSFLTTIIVGLTISHLETLSEKQIAELAFGNRVVALFSTIAFAVANIFFEDKYIHELRMQSRRVIESRSRFLATMGHELRTPLNGIIGVINLLKNEESKEHREEYMSVLKYCSDHMLQQVNNILDFNKIEADKLEIHPIRLNLRQLLLNISMPFTNQFQEKGLKMMVDIDPALDMFVMADDLRLIQIFNNLISNALKFTDQGYVKLQARLIERGKKGATVQCCVIDSGIGIAPADQEQVFRSFWQVYDESTKQLDGTGLGLTICARLLKLMDSKLKLESEKGKGSKFSFELDLPYAAQAEQPKKVAEKENLAGINILLAEDDQVNMMVAKKTLSNLAAKVTGVYDGKQTLEELAKVNNFDVLLLDLQMPVMNGYEAIFEIKRLYPNLPVIAFTASLVDREMLSELLASGFDDCMLKPFQPHQLLSVIKKSIATHKDHVNVQYVHN